MPIDTQMEDDMSIELALSESASSHSGHRGLHDLLEEVIAGMPGFITGYLSAHPVRHRRRRRRRRLAEELEHAQEHIQERTRIDHETDLSEREMELTRYIAPGVLNYHHHLSEIGMAPYTSPEILGYHVHFTSDSLRRPPAPRSLIWALSAKEIDKEMLEELQQFSSSSCSICIEDFQVSQEVCALSCKHLFHSTCIRRWLYETNSCPMCREGRAVRDFIHM
jgi:hypothetical protein